MPGQESAPKYEDWLKNIYSEMNLKFQGFVDGVKGNRSGGVTSKTSEASAVIRQQSEEDPLEMSAQSELDDFVLTGTPSEERKKRPITAALKDAGINPSEALSQRLDAYQAVKVKHDEDPLAAAYADPEAVKWDRLIKGTLGQDDRTANKMVLQQHTVEMKKQSRQLTRDVLQEQCSSPEFRESLRNASKESPYDMSNEQREMLILFSQNMKVLGNELVHTTNEVMREKAFGESMMKTLREANSYAVSDREKQRLAELEDAAVSYGVANSKQLALALNCTNHVEATVKRGRAMEQAVDQLADQRPKAIFASSAMQRTAEQMTHNHLEKSNNIKKTMAWAEQQPWSQMVKVTIKQDGLYFDISSEPNTAPETPARTGNFMVDNHLDLPHKSASKTELGNTPELVFNGLRSDELIDAMYLQETGEEGPEGLPFVGIPSETSMALAETLLSVQQAGQDLSSKLPDYMELKEVWYREKRTGLAGKLKRGKPEKKVHVVTYKETSESIEAAQMVRFEPQRVAAELVGLADNMAGLKTEQTAKAEKMKENKAELEKFLSSKGEGLLQSFGEAHEAFEALQDNILQQVIAKMGSGTSLKKIQKWASKQTWALLFEIEFKPDPSGAKDSYNVVVKEKIQEPEEENDSNPENGRVEADSQGHEGGDTKLKGALAALANPAVQKHLVLNYTSETHDGLPVVEKPSDLATKWADTIMGVYGSSAKLPDYLVLKDVVYKSKSRNPVRRGKFIPCKAIEFIPSAFKH